MRLKEGLSPLRKIEGKYILRPLTAALLFITVSCSADASQNNPLENLGPNDNTQVLIATLRVEGNVFRRTSAAITEPGPFQFSNFAYSGVKEEVENPFIVKGKPANNDPKDPNKKDQYLAYFSTQTNGFIYVNYSDMTWPFIQTSNNGGIRACSVRLVDLERRNITCEVSNNGKQTIKKVGASKLLAN